MSVYSHHGFHFTQKSDKDNVVGCLPSNCSVVSWFGEGLLRDKDTIQEFTLVLGSDLAHLGNLGAAEGDEGVVETVEDELVLNILGKLNSASGLEVDGVGNLAAEEVLDLNLSLVLGDVGVDGEMCMDKSHLVAETLKQKSQFKFIIKI